MKMWENYRVIKARPARSQRGLYESIDMLDHEGMRETLLKPFTQLHGGLLPKGSKTRHRRI
jgi:hypothetical protein